MLDVTRIAGSRSFDWVMQHAKQVDDNVVLDFDHNQITLTNVSIASLHTDDFLL